METSVLLATRAMLLISAVSLVIGLWIGFAAGERSGLRAARVINMFPLLLPKFTVDARERKQVVEIVERELQRNHSN